MAEWLVEGIIATISGVLTVFLVLILISVVISLLKYVDKISFKKKSVKSKGKTVKTVENEVVVDIIKEPKQDEVELVAVITAVIATTLNITADQLKIKSFRRIDTYNNTWNRR